MNKKKKNSNKENNKYIKKVPLITVPSFNIIQDTRIPTITNTQLKGLVKSIQLKKTNLINPYKKSISRKSTCKSVKQTINHRPPQLKTIMQTFKQLKFIHENSRSKSKSPASCKSRSTKKYFPKKKSYTTLFTKPSSQVNLTLKLQKTIKQLNQKDFFRDQDSILPIKSTSDLMKNQQNIEPIIPENQQYIDLAELRQFCSTTIKHEKSIIQLSHKNYKLFKENRAALKIQTAWKQYHTRKLVQRYINLYKHAQRHIISQDFNLNEYEQIQNFHEIQSQKNEQIIISSQQFYPQNIQNNKIRHISNLQDQVKNDYQQIVKKMKIQQLNKWNQIIKIISINKSNNPQEIEKLLTKLTQQSEINKKDLQIKTNTILNKNNKIKNIKTQQQRKIIEENQQRKEPKCQYTSSDHSIPEQYDSRKYIQYLDGDIFPIESSPSSTSEKYPKGVKISKRDQEMLLQSLKHSNLPIKLGQDALYRSQSMKTIVRGHHRRHSSKSSSRSILRKSTSQKILRNFIQDSNNSLQQQQQVSQINLDLLTRQFLQGSDPSTDNFDMVYSQQKLKSKLAELTKMKQQYINENQSIRSQKIFIRQQNDQDNKNQQAQLRCSYPSYIIHQNRNQQIKIQDNTPQKLQIQIIQAEIASDSDEVQQELSHKSQACANIILNILLMQVLRQIAKSQIISESFKQYSLSLRPKIRKSEGIKKKKGFPTNKAQIQLFLQGLIKYLDKQEPNIFKNLEVSTGPSALQMLRYMHQLNEEAEEQQQSEQDQSNVMVISNRVFDAFWKLKQKSIVIQVPQHFDHSNTVIFKHQFELLKSFNKIFYRSLFDTFNECLDCQRNFGQYGRPFPWKRAPVFDHIKSTKCLNQSVQLAKKKMMDISTTYCGLIIQKQDMTGGVSEQYIKQVHQDRLSRMLANDLIDAEDRWIFYDDEETEILVQIANALYTEILIQVIEELYQNL